MSAARNALNIVMLDACRDNPLSRQPARRAGLSRVDSSSSLFVSFSTSPGEVALDGAGRNSPYTKHLKDAIATPNLDASRTPSSARSRASIRRPAASSSRGSRRRSSAISCSGRAPAAPAALPPPSQQQAGAVGIPPRMAPGGALVPGTAPALGGHLFRRRHQSERQPLPRHGRADAGRQSVPFHLVDRDAGLSPASGSSPDACWW